MGAGKWSWNGNDGFKNNRRTKPSTQSTVISLQPGFECHSKSSSASCSHQTLLWDGVWGPRWPCHLCVPLTAGEGLGTSSLVVTSTAKAWGRRDSVVAQGGSQGCAWRGDSSPRAAQCPPAGTLVDREDTWKLLSEASLGKNERHINPPSDSRASHLSPGRQKRGEACLKPCTRARNSLRYCKPSPVHWQRNMLWLCTTSLASSIQGLGESCPK